MPIIPCPKFFPHEGNLYFVDITFVIIRLDLKVTGCDERGIFYADSGRIIVYLNNHETLDDVLCTITHELIHKCIDDFDETLDDLQEESLIYQMAWAHLSIA